VNLENRIPPVRALVLVLGGGLLAATLDIVFAWAFWAMKSGVPPSRILQSVAAGVLGESSFQGGRGTAALGFILHYLIVIVMAMTYYLFARRWLPLRTQPLLCGAAYGLLLYGVMHYLVVPLSRAGSGPDDLLWVTSGVLAHVFLVGIPVALFARRAIAGAAATNG
jgi:uncharacterized membrane protein YagU involved in acid resistance